LTGVAAASGRVFDAGVTVDMVKEDGYWRIVNSTYRGTVQL